MVSFRFKSLQDIDAKEGTVKLVDGILPLFISHSIDAHQLKSKANTDIVLVPQPSDNVNDPLNWPKWKKVFAFLSICFYTFLGSWVMGGISLGIPGIMTDFEVDLNKAVKGVVSWTVLTVGIGVHINVLLYSLIGVELFLDSNRSLLWETTRLSFCIHSCVGRNNLVCRSKDLWKFGRCSGYLRHYIRCV